MGQCGELLPSLGAKFVGARLPTGPVGGWGAPPRLAQPGTQQFDVIGEQSQPALGKIHREKSEPGGDKVAAVDRYRPGRVELRWVSLRSTYPACSKP